MVRVGKVAEFMHHDIFLCSRRHHAEPLRKRQRAGAQAAGAPAGVHVAHSDFGHLPARAYRCKLRIVCPAQRLHMGQRLGFRRQIRLFGKGHKERMVYLNDACIEALQLYLKKRNTMEGLDPKEKAVFVTRRMKDRISNRRVEQLVTGAMKAAGLKGFSTHKLRHTAATLMYQTGNVDILTLKQLLGHSSVGTTQIYTHLQEFQVRAAIEQNPLGEVRKTNLDTTKQEAGETHGGISPSGAEMDAGAKDAPDDAAEMPTGPMEAFDGAAKDGFRVDVSALREPDASEKTER